MQILTNPGEALQAIAVFLANHLNDQPEDQRQQLLDVATNADAQMRIINTGEFIWARREFLTDDAKQLGASIAHFGGTWDLHYYKEGRGFHMARALRRDLGEPAPEGTAWDDPANDPDIRPEWTMTDPGSAQAPASPAEA